MATVLEEAEMLINGQRAQDYGDVNENFGRIRDMWNAYLGEEADLSSYDVANMMILVKVSRLANGYHRDSLVDVAGYSALAEQVNEGTEGHHRTRTWVKFNEIPEGTLVVDREGDEWIGEGRAGDSKLDKWGPFIEVRA